MPLAIFKGSTDISESLNRDSLHLTEELNNRKNIATFITNNQKIDEGSIVEIYDTVRIRTDSGSEVLTWDNEENWDNEATWDGYQNGILKCHDLKSCEYAEKWRAGDEIILDIKGANEAIFIIDSVDYDTEEITLTKPVTFTVTPSMKCGRLIHAGVCMKPIEREVGNENYFEYTNTVQDWMPLFDAENITDTFLTMYSREILGRVTYGKSDWDTSLDVHDFETAWTESGVARAMVDNTDDELEGTKCQDTGATGAGTAKWTTSVSSLDMSSYDNLRFWWKVASGKGALISSLKIRIGTDSSNYWEWNIPRVGENYEDCWNYESIRLKRHDELVGSPIRSDIDWVEIEVVTTDALASGELQFDHMFCTTGSFTLTGVERGVIKFDEFRVPDRKPTVFMDKMTKEQSMFWYIENTRDIKMFEQNSGTAPFSLTESSQNFGGLEVTRDLEKIVNRQTVRGGEAASESTHTQIFEADGSETSWPLDYGYKNLVVSVNTGAGYVEKTVGIDNVDDDASFDFMANFTEKFVRNANHATLNSGDLIKFVYNPYLPIKVRVQSNASIARMKSLVGGNGIFDGRIIVDDSIPTFQQARQRARAEVDEYGNTLVTVKFWTDQDGLHPGQIINITDTARSLNAEDFLIQQVVTIPRDTNKFKHTITAGTTLFGLTEFFQLLLRRTEDQLDIDINEQVETVTNIDETITLTDSVTPTQKSDTFDVSQLHIQSFMFHDLGGSFSKTTDGILGNGLRGTNWFAVFGGGETGSVAITTGNYESGKDLILTADTGGDGLEVKAFTPYRIGVEASTEYTVTAWLQILADLTNVGSGGGAKLVIREYADKTTDTVLATNTIFSGKTSEQSFLNEADAVFTTNASTAFIEIEFSLYRAAGQVSLGRIKMVESGADGATNPALAGLSQATTP